MRKLFALSLAVVFLASLAMAKPNMSATPAKPATPAVPGVSKAVPATPAMPGNPTAKANVMKNRKAGKHKGAKKGTPKAAPATEAQ